MRRLMLIAIAASCLVPSGPSARAAPVFSAEERAEGLLEGRGMGLAAAAENNGYPGPWHVLDAADQLKLSAEQRKQTAQLVDAMKAKAAFLIASDCVG